MKSRVKMLFLYCLLFLATSIFATHNSNAVTYELNGGRFGDNLLSYSRAKWLSYIYDLPLQLFPFPYADQLMLYELEEMLCMDNFKHVIRLTSEKDISTDDHYTLYINHWRNKVAIDWNDLAFIELLKETIKPRYDLATVTIPEGYFSVAIHVRKGGEFAADTQQEQERCPLRFVSDEFFIEQIKRITLLFPEENIYVYIFTDYKQPEELVKKFGEAINNDRVIFDCRKEKNSHNSNILEDFFAMMQFNCLIRPGSHFSRFVERLGNAQLVIYPYSSKRINKKLVIDVIGIKTRLASGKWKTEKYKIID